MPESQLETPEPTTAHKNGMYKQLVPVVDWFLAILGHPLRFHTEPYDTCNNKTGPETGGSPQDIALHQGFRTAGF